MGQRQLFALARALLCDCRILALDEATANVDHATDAVVQRSLQRIASSTRFSGGRSSKLAGSHFV